eukprot:37350-Rhodomonas_salina.1
MIANAAKAVHATRARVTVPVTLPRYLSSCRVTWAWAVTCLEHWRGEVPGGLLVASYARSVPDMA